MEPSTTRSYCPRCRAMFRRSLRRCPLDGSETRPLPPDPQIGQRLGDGYEVVAVTGERGDCRVYRALGLDGGEVEVHVLFGELAAIRRHRWRFLDGAEHSTRFDHRNIHRVLDFGCTGSGVPYAIAELSSGNTLGTIIDGEAPLPASRAARLGRDVCAALEHVHARGAVHGALTAERVLVDTRGGVELARVTGLAVPGCGPRPGKLPGSPEYLAPERAQGGAATEAVDLYAVGVLLYTMLAGKPPFDGAGLAVALRHGWDRPPPIRQRAPGVPVDDELEAVALRLLDKEPRCRGDAAQARRALERRLD